MKTTLALATLMLSYWMRRIETPKIGRFQKLETDHLNIKQLKTMS